MIATPSRWNAPKRRTKLPQSSRKKNALRTSSLEPELAAIWDQLQQVIPDPRNWERLRRLSFGLLVANGPQTITNMMDATGRRENDFSADYRVFSRGLWEPHAVFEALTEQVLSLDPNPELPVVAPIDDTHCRKTGTRIPGVSYVRDPMSPKFRPNFIRGQRFVQASIVVPFGPGATPSRAFPVAFDHSPSARKPPSKASDEQKATFRVEQKAKRLSRYGLKTIIRLRDNLDRCGRSERDLLVATDTSYTCKEVLKNLPERTYLIGRIRKDAVLHDLPVQQPGRGRKRWYGDRALTPEEYRRSDSVSWQTVQIFAAGRVQECKVKEVQPLLSRIAGADRPLRLIIIAPLGYRLRKNSRVLYRDPAYLITTDMTSSVEDLVQAYFRRWDIEVNHRDEKQLFGLGKAQVRSPLSVDRVPAFVVICYSILLIAAARAYGLDATTPNIPPPKWHPQARQQIRIPTRQILSDLRNALTFSGLTSLSNFSHFMPQIPISKNGQKSTFIEATHVTPETLAAQ